MNAKRSDKIATGVLYVLSGIIVAILAFLLIYILAKGIPHISWKFITTASNPLTGGGIATAFQFGLSFDCDTNYFHSFVTRCWDLSV